MNARTTSMASNLNKYRGHNQSDIEFQKESRQRKISAISILSISSESNTRAHFRVSESFNQNDGVSLVFENNEDFHKYTKGTRSKRLWTSSASKLYGMVIFVIAFAFHIAKFNLDATWAQDYAGLIFRFYLYSTSSLYLAFVISERFIRNTFQKITQFLTKKKIQSCHIIENENSTGRLANSNVLLNSDSTNILKLSDDDQESISYCSEIEREVICQQQTKSFRNGASNSYLKIGCLIFGIANLVYLTIEILQIHKKRECGLRVDNLNIRYMHMGFLILQTAFLFRDNHQNIRRYSKIADFGLIHVAVTNVILCLRSLISETVEFMDMLNEEKGYNSSKECLSILSYLDSIDIIMFPFVLEYSFVAGVTLFSLYHSNHIKIAQDSLQSIIKYVTAIKSEIPECNHQRGVFAKSNKGIYLGCILICVCLVSIIDIRINGRTEATREVGTVIYYATNAGIDLFVFIAVLHCSYSLRDFEWSWQNDNKIDNVLLFITLFGIMMNDILCCFAGINEDFRVKDTSLKDFLLICSPLSNTITATMQASLISKALQKHAENESQEKSKPGKGTIGFLILANIAEWLLKTVEYKPNPPQFYDDFFSQIGWFIIINTTVPMSLFFYFHSSVLLAGLWTKIYIRKDSIIDYKIM